MSDRIPSITGNLDRSDLNVKGVSNTKKKLAAIFAVIAVILIVVIAVVVMISNFNKATGNTEIKAVNENHVTGSKRSSISNDANWFDKARVKIIESESLKPEPEPEPEPEPKPKPKPEPKPVTKPKEVVVKRTSRAKPKPVVTPKPIVVNPPINQKPVMTDMQRKLKGSLVVGSGGASGNVDIASLNASSGGFGGSGYDDSFNGSLFEPGKALIRPRGALDFLLKHGTSIPCALYNQIISDYSGFVTCRVTQDVYSANGAVLLVEKGSLVSGTQNVSLEPGKSRIFTAWADIETPKGVSIRIDSLGTGALGAAGNEVWVDNHFSERFGGAIMLSFVDDALATLSSLASETSVISSDSSTQNASDMASTALEASINIAPTGYSQIGQRINILIVRDVDMSGVYQLIEGN
ncbi:TrbI/VirB10 family protein [Vibrio sp. R78045]|uniref:TrbI/VirB10 family protein n=1 Tax=Vibrio sp. R78045 TaxID=3093868 RepID=UPI0036F3CC73